MKKTYILFIDFLCLILLISCGPAISQNQNKTQDAIAAIPNDLNNSSETQVQETYHLSINAREPKYAEAMAAIECSVYPMPDDKLDALGKLWYGKKVFVEKTAEVLDLNTGNASSWCLICTTYNPDYTGTNIGWVPSSHLQEYQEATFLSSSALYQLKPGAEYRFGGELLKHSKEDVMYVLTFDSIDEESGALNFTAYGGAVISVENPNFIEPYEGLIPPDWSMVP